MRLIDAGMLLGILPKTDTVLSMDVRKAIVDAPTVDAVPVVRCKDCKYWHNGDCYRLELSSSHDFCSYGEKKGEAK